MFSALAILIDLAAAGFLVRADGWGGSERWEKLSDFFNVFTCSALFATLCALSAPPLDAFAAGLVFLVWRIFGFRNGGASERTLARIPGWLGRTVRAMVVKEGGWQSYTNMFVRGAWTGFIGFTLLSFVVHGHPFYAWLFIPFAATYACIYTGGYMYLPDKILGYDRHVWIEHASGWLLRACVILILCLPSDWGRQPSASPLFSTAYLLVS